MKKSQYFSLFLILVICYNVQIISAIFEEMEFTAQQEIYYERMNSLRNSTSSGATNMNDVRYLIFADYFVSYNDDVCTLSHFPNYLYGNFSGYPVALFKDFTTTEQYITSEQFADIIDDWFLESNYYTYSNKTCQQGKDCKFYLTAMWHSVQYMACSQINCTNASYNGTTYNATEYGCAFFLPPTDGEMVSQNPYIHANSSNLVCSDCPQDQPYCRNGLCSGVGEQCPYHQNTDYHLYCQDITQTDCTNSGYLTTECPYTCNNCYKQTCYDYRSVCDQYTKSQLQAMDLTTRQYCPLKLEDCKVQMAMTDELKYIILNNINGIRMGLHDVPSGSLFLAWDENLAKSAAYEASFCRRNASYYSDYSKRQNLFNFSYVSEIQGIEQTYLSDLANRVDFTYNYTDNTCTGTNQQRCKDLNKVLYQNATKIGCSHYNCDGNTFQAICHIGEGKEMINGTTSISGRTFTRHSSVDSSGNYQGRPFCENCPSTHPYCQQFLCTDQEYSIDDEDESCQDLDQNCSTWAANGLCKAFPGYYMSQCPSSCGSCNGELCVDQPIDNRGYVCGTGLGWCDEKFYYKYFCPAKCLVEGCLADCGDDCQDEIYCPPEYCEDEFILETQLCKCTCGQCER